MFPPSWEVQCQRTRLFLLSPIAEGESGICSYCNEHETYERLPAGHATRNVVEDAMRVCREEFGVAADNWGTAVWLGNKPEAVFEPHLNRCNIYLGRESDPLQIMYSGSHEAFHRVCGAQQNTVHWIDEMFSVLFSLLYLERRGEVMHAAKCTLELVGEAERCSWEEMLAVTKNPMPDGLYGRAYVVGQMLSQSIGWDALKPLAVTHTADGFPDVHKWLASLSDAEREKAGPLLEGALVRT